MARTIDLQQAAPAEAGILQGPWSPRGAKVRIRPLARAAAYWSSSLYGEIPNVTIRAVAEAP